MLSHGIPAKEFVMRFLNKSVLNVDGGYHFVG
jgi:hypothetical protein